jgi:hypothetical protein
MNGDTTWLALPLTMAQTIDKHNATREYHTQGGGIDPLLESFSRATELYGVPLVRSWPDADWVGPTQVITDPPRDIDTAAARPFADITGVRLAREEGDLVAEVELQGAANARTGYHLSLNAGSGSPADRVVMRLDWQGAKVQSAVLGGEALRRLPPAAVTVSRAGHIARIRAPWPLPSVSPAYIILRAWTTGAGRPLDQTGFSLLRVGDRG